jgi:alpha,alpha-trehalase
MSDYLMDKPRRNRALASTFCLPLLIFILLLGACAPAPAQQSSDGLKPILDYIDRGWTVLSRSPTDCKTVHDPKTERSFLYFPANFDIPASAQPLTKCGVSLEHLPAPITRLGQVDMTKVRPPALLYLPNTYVVPGGFFNEMYGWDSYFIIRGLLRDNRVDIARGMVENFFFEIEHYGAVLNANRGYFLTRSQPPFLTSMIMGVHEAQKAARKDDRAWLARAYDYAKRDYELWTREPHLAGDTGLARYFDFGEGPVPEITNSRDTYYYDVARQLAARPQLFDGYLTPEAVNGTPTEWPRLTSYMCPDGSTPGSNCSPAGKLAFTSDYYKGDRSMRESGFDISFRFGPFGAGTHHFAPVCLNSLLFKTEQDLGTLARMLGRNDEATQWEQRAEARRAAINKYMWDEKSGMFFDWNIEKGTRSDYVYASTFYPLWAGLATKEQAQAVAANLKRFEQPGGLATSDRETGVQWDLPYGWAPLQLIAVEGLRRYGFEDGANSIASKFVSTVLENFRRDGTIREKYNVVTRSSEAKVTAGYQTNVVGFGWTNGVFLELLHELPQAQRDRLAQGPVSAR